MNHLHVPLRLRFILRYLLDQIRGIPLVALIPLVSLIDTVINRHAIVRMPRARVVRLTGAPKRWFSINGFKPTVPAD